MIGEILKDILLFQGRLLRLLFCHASHSNNRYALLIYDFLVSVLQFRSCASAQRLALVPANLSTERCHARVWPSMQNWRSYSNAGNCPVDKCLQCGSAQHYRWLVRLDGITECFSITCGPRAGLNPAKTGRCSLSTRVSVQSIDFLVFGLVHRVHNLIDNSGLHASAFAGKATLKTPLAAARKAGLLQNWPTHNPSSRGSA